MRNAIRIIVFMIYTPIIIPFFILLLILETLSFVSLKTQRAVDTISTIISDACGMVFKHIVKVSDYIIKGLCK